MPSLTAASLALSLWFKNIGMAIAARIPMMMITIRSSMSVKPFWPLVNRFIWIVAFLFACLPTALTLSFERDHEKTTRGASPASHRSCCSVTRAAAATQPTPVCESCGFAPRPHRRFAFSPSYLGCPTTDGLDALISAEDEQRPGGSQAMTGSAVPAAVVAGTALQGG